MLYINSAVKIRAPLNGILANNKSVEISVQNTEWKWNEASTITQKKNIKKGNLLSCFTDGKRRCWRLDVGFGCLRLVTASAKQEAGGLMIVTASAMHEAGSLSEGLLQRCLMSWIRW